MINELVIDVSPSQVSVALIEDKQLVELTKEKSDSKFAVGDVYLARVKKVMPGLNAAFVDVGYNKDAFLHYHDLGPQFQSMNKFLVLALSKKGKYTQVQKMRREKDINKHGKINQVLKAGQKVIVQIAKEPISTKGPRLTSEISIPGRNIVVMPFSDRVSISQKIESLEEKNRLKTLIQSIKPKNFGVIVRTVAQEKRVALLDEELRGLIKKWDQAFEKIKGANPPVNIIHEMNMAYAFVRDHLDVSYSNIYINDEAIYQQIKDYIKKIAPEKEKIVKLYNKKVPIFEHFGIEKQIKSLFGPTVSFKSGSYLVIEHTEALHSIDVNSGYRSKSAIDQETNAFETNLAAADAIAQQLRLRDMGGLVVIDFIDMKENKHKAQVFEKMKEAMAKDKTKHSILPLSKFGLMQITRQRVRPEMNIKTLEKCPACKGTGEVTPSIIFDDVLENNIQTIQTTGKQKKITIHVHPYVASYLNKGFFNSVKKNWTKKFSCKIEIVEEHNYHMLEYRFFGENGEELELEGES